MEKETKVNISMLLLGGEIFALVGLRILIEDAIG